MTTKDFWNRVKKLIKAHNMTQKQFTEYIGIPLDSFKSMVYNNREPVFSLAVDMAKALGVTVDYLSTGNDRELKNLRLKELENRQAASKLLKLAKEMQKEAEKIIGKGI